MTNTVSMNISSEVESFSAAIASTERINETLPFILWSADRQWMTVVRADNNSLGGYRMDVIDVEFDTEFASYIGTYDEMLANAEDWIKFANDAA